MSLIKNLKRRKVQMFGAIKNDLEKAKKDLEKHEKQTKKIDQEIKKQTKNKTRKNATKK